ncbi:hypothetical protein AX16_004040 [Volvariella volvacea WC 439]|nr:hypothetical protein AX16_004040 [Volvariella volvacea WC 439]
MSNDWAPDGYRLAWSAGAQGQMSLPDFLNKYKPSRIENEDGNTWIWVRRSELDISHRTKQAAVYDASAIVRTLTTRVREIQSDSSIPVRPNKKEGIKSKKELRDEAIDEATENLKEICLKSGYISGHWIMTAPQPKVDMIWRQIATSLIDGPLSETSAYCARVATARDYIPYPDCLDLISSEQCLIQVFISDVFDKKRVMRVLLRDHGAALSGVKSNLYADLGIVGNHASGLQPTALRNAFFDEAIANKERRIEARQIAREEREKEKQAKAAEKAKAKEKAAEEKQAKKKASEPAKTKKSAATKSAAKGKKAKKDEALEEKSQGDNDEEGWNEVETQTKVTEGRGRATSKSKSTETSKGRRSNNEAAAVMDEEGESEVDVEDKAPKANSRKTTTKTRSTASKSTKRTKKVEKKHAEAEDGQVEDVTPAGSKGRGKSTTRGSTSRKVPKKTGSDAEAKGDVKEGTVTHRTTKIGSKSTRVTGTEVSAKAEEPVRATRTRKRVAEEAVESDHIEDEAATRPKKRARTTKRS